MSARLIYDDGASPTPSPAKVVPATPKSGPSLRVILPWVAVAVLFVIVVGVGVAVVVVGLPGSPDAPPGSPAFALGRAFRGQLDPPLADGFDAYADTVAPGKVPEANKALKKAFHDAAEKAFADANGAAITAITPDGSNPTDDATIARLKAFHRDFAQGLRSGR